MWWTLFWGLFSDIFLGFTQVNINNWIYGQWWSESRPDKCPQNRQNFSNDWAEETFVQQALINGIYSSLQDNQYNARYIHTVLIVHNYLLCTPSGLWVMFEVMHHIIAGHMHLALGAAIMEHNDVTGPAVWNINNCLRCNVNRQSTQYRLYMDTLHYTHSQAL